MFLGVLAFSEVGIFQLIAGGFTLKAGFDHKIGLLFNFLMPSTGRDYTFEEYPADTERIMVHHGISLL